MTILLNLVLLAVGFVMLVKGADFFVDGAAGIAGKFGIPELVIGLTIVAMGTSAPESAVSITSALSGDADITIGNVVGSNILNILIVLGVTAVVQTLKVERSTLRIEMPFLIVMSALFLALGFDGTVGFLDGVILWACFILYLVCLYYMATHNAVDPETVDRAADDTKVEPLWKLLVLAVGGVVLVVWGGDITVDAATELARAFGMSERIIGLTIVALGTSLPELVTSVTAARRGEADIAIGNVVGSCIFNLLFVTGTTALITDIPFASDFLFDAFFCLGITLLLFVLANHHHRVSRRSGITLLAFYVLYLVHLLLY